LATFELHPAFQIELVAAEPVVFDPVDLEFDEHGHAYVIEMPGYPFPEQEGRVVRLSDADNDGAYETRTVFAEGFPVASSILPFNGGILVASPPDLIFVKDTDGDGVADIRDTVMTGFSFGNTQHNYNGLTYGLDNWIHAGNGGNSGRVTWTDSNADPVSIRGVDFRFDLRTKQFETTGRTSGGFEIAFDKWGRNFQTHNLYHISQLVFPGKFIDALPSMSSGTLTLISDHEEGGLARIFPIGVQESRVNHPEQAGYFSGSCGITYYGGGAFPDGFNGNMFVCDVVLNLIHRDVLSPDGAALKASRGRDRAAFLASTDRSFRPVNMTTGPDGALYVLDMHRDAIEHPEWIPDELEADLDIDAGKDKGRIYRITPKGGLSLSNAVFKRDNLQSMVDTLSHPNKWWRDTAQRLLVEWEDEKVVPLLHNALDDSQSAVGRLHAMWTLQGLGALEYNDLAQALRDDDAGVRENALQIAADRTADSPQLRDSVLTLANDRDARVRLFAAIALQSTPSNDEVSDALATILDQDMDDPWTRMAVTAAAASDPNELMIRLIAKDSISNGDGSFVKLICRTAALNPTSGAWAALLEIIGDATDGPLLTAAFDGVATGFESHNRSIDDANPEIEGLIKRCMSDGSPALVAQALRVARVTGVDLASTQEDLIDEAMAIAQNQNAPTEARIQQLELVAFAPYKSRDDLLFDLLDTREPRTVQNAAIAQITDDGSIEDAKRLIAMWPTLGPDVRKSAGDYLLYRRANNALLLDALEDGRLKLGELNLHLERRRQLLWSRDKAVAQRSEKLFSDAGVVTRATAIDDMRPALSLTGNAELGKAIFQERCAECHRIGGDGFDVGPNLTDIFRKSPETLLHDILDPNAGAEPEYLAYTVEPTAEDLNAEIVSGLLVAETDDAITLRQAGGAETTFARSAIASFSTTGLSLMPEELEADLDHHAFADLLAYLLETR
jgi:putative membrane-bound dehydrogenase-like protein